MEACREQAAEHGEQPKSESENGMAGCMRRKFERFLERHGDAYSYEAELRPTVELVRRFVEYCWSGAGREQLFSGRYSFKAHGAIQSSGENFGLFKGQRALNVVPPGAKRMEKNLAYSKGFNSMYYHPAQSAGENLCLFKGLSQHILYHPVQSARGKLASSKGFGSIYHD